MTYRETLDFLFSQLPAFTRVGKAAYKADLDNITALCKALGNPQTQFKSIHVAGTNGKGSSSHFLSSIFQEAGYKTALFTSPHLKDFRERIRINGRPISQQRVVRFVEEHKQLFDQIKPSFFEMNVALAFSYFAEKQVDIAIIETGLGGRLDSTNLIHPEMSLITNISLDHMDLLGDTLVKIAGEKAGIIKKNIPVVIGERMPGSAPVFIETASRLNAELVFAEDQIQWSTFTQSFQGDRMFLSADGNWNDEPITLSSPLPGLYQLKNLKGVLASVSVMRRSGWRLSNSAVVSGIAHVINATGLKGRWDILQTQPLVVADTGHNEAGIRELLYQIQNVPHTTLHMVWGMVSDKEVEKILRLLPANASYYFCRAKLPRAMDAAVLAEKAANCGLKGEIFSSVRTALNAAKRAAKQEDMIVIGGSTFVVAEII